MKSQAFKIKISLNISKVFKRVKWKKIGHSIKHVNKICNLNE